MKHSNFSPSLNVGLLAAGLLVTGCARAQTAPETVRVPLSAAMLSGPGDKADFAGLVDEQDGIGDVPTTQPKTGWTVKSYKAEDYPLSAIIDLGREMPLEKLWIYDTNGQGSTQIYAGKPDDWTPVALYDGGLYQTWKAVDLNVKTRYLRVEVSGGDAMSGELALYAYSDAGWQNYSTRKVAADKALAERTARIEQAKAEVANRAVVEMAPFGKLSLVDEIDLGAADPGHGFVQSPADVSKIEKVLGRNVRVIPPTEGESAYMQVRVGQYKLLKPGGQYVLSVEYPEDVGRTVIVRNGGDETTRGFHTGRALGDALHPKYVDNQNESLNLPLSGEFRNWQSYFSLHDRFPDEPILRDGGERALVPDDGFNVTIAQFSAINDPTSAGAAVGKVRLYEVLEPEKLNANYALPEGLPQRHLFWREEMADGVIHDNDPKKRGLQNRLDWYRNKARLMHFLGMNTYGKDLLEFGAVQHWDSSPLGGNNWAYFNSDHKDLWGQIVEMMGREGFSILPYYEYAGSKGINGLGGQRRAKPLTRDDAYTHIGWIESDNADITDPDTFADFKKMLDLTVVRQKDKAKFVGIWMRPRGQMPMSFGEGALNRFATESNGGATVTRKDLIAGKALLSRYENWWMGKRREFLDGMRDYLVQNGVTDPLVLFTAVNSEPGVPFADWEKRFVTDSPDYWTPILDSPAQKGKDAATKAITPQQISAQGLYLKALTASPKTWGDWEWNYGNPQPDPQNYKNDAGILMTHGFNRAYTVESPATMEAFRNGNRLAMLRFYSLNENMMFDKADKEKLGYFAADIEMAGPYCMLAEARAVANGDPTEIGYLSGNNFQRGFPQYVRAFNTAFLSLPALPSTVVANATTDPDVVVRQIVTPDKGTYYAVVNTGLQAKKAVKIQLPKGGKVVDAATKMEVGQGNTVTVDLGACELRSWWVAG